LANLRLTLSSCLLFLLALLLAACTAPQPSGLQPQRDPAIPWPLLVPPGFRVALYASGLGEVRSIAFSPGGVPYVTVMKRSRRGEGTVLALPDDNRDGRADRTVVVADKLDRPHGLVFYKGELYVSDSTNIFRLHDANGDLVADQRELVVGNMPNRGDHWSRPFVFTEQGDILVAVGSSCNICQEGDKRRATILRYPAAMLGQDEQRPEIYARGLRSVVGLTLRPGTQELWATNNGPDHLGTKEPPDQLFKIEAGRHYGWPYCVGDRTPDPTVLTMQDIVTPDGTPKDVFCREQVTSPDLLLPVHVAPLNLEFYNAPQFPVAMQGSLFITLRGSFDFSNLDGYKVIRVPFIDGKPQPPQDFLAGLAVPGEQKWRGRPVGVTVGPEGSLYVTDDTNGSVYRIDYTGTSATNTRP
jgi:glucose/arabinose dehydrogenase